MSLTLVVEDNIRLQDFYHLNLYTWVGTEVLIAKNAKFAQEELDRLGKKVNLIITRHQIQTEKTFEAIEYYLESNGLDTPLISLGIKRDDSPGKTYFVSGIDIQPIIKASAGYLEITAKIMAEKAVEEFFPIPIQLLNSLSIAEVDIYHEPEQILTQAQSQIPHTMLKEHIAAGTDFYYVHKNDRLRFVTNYNQVVASELNKLELNKDEAIQASEMSQDLLKNRITKVGINDETIELANRNLKEMVALTKKEPSLIRLLKRLLKNKSGYLFKHTQLLMYVGTHLMDHLDWGTDEQRDKFHFIAYWHDISLENDEQAKIHSNEELKASTIPAKKKDLVKKHAMLSAGLVAQYPNAPLGVEQIIKQHHGSLNGVGFSDHYSQNVSPMAIVHVLVEDFVKALMEQGDDFNLKMQILKMKKKYTTQRFVKILEVLETITT